MKQPKKINQLVLKRLILGALVSCSFLFQEVKSEDVSSQVLGFLFEAILEIATDSPVSHREYRRRVTFKNITTGKNHTGGITVKYENRRNMDASLYIYDQYKFGSRGKYVEFNIKDLDILPGNVTESKQLVKFSDFGLAAWARSESQNLNFFISSKAAEQSPASKLFTTDKMVEEFLKNLKVNSVDPGYPDFGIEVIKVNDAPRSHYFRYIFYSVNFAFFCVICNIDQKVNENMLKYREKLPQRATIVHFLVALIALRLLVTYFFIVAVYFWAIFIVNALIKMTALCNRIRQRQVFCLFLTLAILLFFPGFIFIDFTPFFILFFNLSLTFDLISDQKITSYHGFNMLNHTLMANVYTAFMFYNPGNRVYYYPSWASAAIWVPLTSLIWIFNLVFLLNLEKFQKIFRGVGECFDGCENHEERKGLFKKKSSGKSDGEKVEDIFDKIHKEKSTQMKLGRDEEINARNEQFNLNQGPRRKGQGPMKKNLRSFNHQN